MSYDPEKRFVIPPGSVLFPQLAKIVREDKWAFIVVWGKQRLGKSTLALWCAYFVWRLLNPRLSENELWERVYESCIFNLSQLMYKIRDKSMHRVYDLKRRHNRIPIFIWDDFGAHSNKAVTQHLEAWDHFKGGFDVLGTKFGIIIITLTTPEQPTSQIEHKYTHEIVITARGRYKFDRVEWLQDYRGWNAKHTKDWQQPASFYEIPWVRFAPYDEMRISLADEVLEKIDDAMASKTPRLLKRLHEGEIKVLKQIDEHGPLSEYARDKFSKKVITKLKSHQLVVPARRSGTKGEYYLDMTRFGSDVLESWNQKHQDIEDTDKT